MSRYRQPAIPTPKTVPEVSAADDAFIRSLVIYEDSEMLVLNKPAGLPVQGGSGIKRDIDTLLWAFANRKGRRPKLVHRLDRETSGVMVVAKTSPAAALLSEQFAERKTQKTYLALVSGAPEHEAGTIDTPLLRVKQGRLDMVRTALADEEGALRALTQWRVLRHGKNAALIEAKPLTGRMHQIRAHLASIGHPILGDDKYGGLFALGTKSIPRVMLHAQRLEFEHPGTCSPEVFEVPMPEDFAKLLEALFP